MLNRADRRFGYGVLVICMTLIVTLLFTSHTGGITSANAITNTTKIHLYRDNTYCIGVKNNSDASGNTVWLSQCSGPDTRTWIEQNVPAPQANADPFCYDQDCVMLRDAKNPNQCLRATPQAELAGCTGEETYFLVQGLDSRLMRNVFWVGAFMQATGDYNHAQMVAIKNQCEGSSTCYDQWNNLQPGG